MRESQGCLLPQTDRYNLGWGPRLPFQTVKGPIKISVHYNPLSVLFIGVGSRRNLHLFIFYIFTLCAQKTENLWTPDSLLLNLSCLYVVRSRNFLFQLGPGRVRLPSLLVYPPSHSEPSSHYHWVTLFVTRVKSVHL